MTDCSHQPGVDPPDILTTFLQSEEQTFEQFTDMFETITISPENDNDTSNSMDGMLSYLQNRENEIVNDTSSTANNDSSFPANQDIPSLSSISTTFPNTGIQCLDVMLNHLEARESSLECSPEYSVELNIGNSSVVIDSEIDNRFHLSNSSENCSSGLPDNDKCAAMIQNDCDFRGESCSYSEDIEVIELNALNDDRSINNSLGGEIFATVMEQPVNLKVDNFVTDNYCYDSDKDIDESEINDGNEFNSNSCYVPSFHQNENAEHFPEIDNITYESITENQTSFEEIPANNQPGRETNLPIIQNEPDYSDRPISQRTLSLSPVMSFDNEQILPGEISDAHSITEESLSVHAGIQNYRTSSSDIVRDTLVSNHNISIDHNNNDLVEPFQLDSNFNYENVQITPRLLHYT